MITLYHCSDARSFRPLWTLEEMGLAYYLALNPLGTIPLLIDGETRMTESAAICQYLATKYGPSPLAVTSDEPDYGAFLNWLHFGEATLTFPQTLVLRYSVLEPQERRLPQAAEDYRRWFLARLRAVDTAVQTRAFLCADRFTAADISVGYALLLAGTLGIDADFTPAVAAYWGRLQARDGYRRAKAAQAREAKGQGVAGGQLDVAARR
jgi:glutathione S-transferase